MPGIDWGDECVLAMRHVKCGGEYSGMNVGDRTARD